MRILIYLFLIGLLIYIFSVWRRQQGFGFPQNDKPKKLPFRGKLNPREMWTQIYETASVDEARILQARLQEEEIECVVYEQGKKDIHGNTTKGIGIVVPRTLINRAQSIVSRFLS